MQGSPYSQAPRLAQTGQAAPFSSTHHPLLQEGPFINQYGAGHIWTWQRPLISPPFAGAMSVASPAVFVSTVNYTGNVTIGLNSSTFLNVYRYFAVIMVVFKFVHPQLQAELSLFPAVR